MAAEQSSFNRLLQATAVLSGSYLSGSMMTISLIAFPAIIDTTTTPSHLLRQWVSMFHYGHRAHPTMAAATLSLYLYAAWRQRTVDKAWTRLLLAGLVTVLMTPFTWFIILSTNKRILRHANETQDAAGIGIDDARLLVRKWSWLHLARSVFPLLGAIIGLTQMFAGQ
ncbi:hypothetical protein BDV12DRAFT_200268 [Aspergillus spectabilis]